MTGENNAEEVSRGRLAEENCHTNLVFKYKTNSSCRLIFKERLMCEFTELMVCDKLSMERKCKAYKVKEKKVSQEGMDTVGQPPYMCLEAAPDLYQELQTETENETVRHRSLFTALCSHVLSCPGVPGRRKAQTWSPRPPRSQKKIEIRECPLKTCVPTRTGPNNLSAKSERPVCDKLRTLVPLSGSAATAQDKK